MSEVRNKRNDVIHEVSKEDYLESTIDSQPIMDRCVDIFIYFESRLKNTSEFTWVID